MRVTLPARMVGTPVISPVIQPEASRSRLTASKCSTPNALAIGRVTNSLVAVTMTMVSPASRCCCSNARAAGWIWGSITSRMNTACAASAASRPSLRMASVAKRTYSWMSSVPFW
ncbi:hypothetical protein D3C72_2130650 [compost metagenome]